MTAASPPAFEVSREEIASAFEPFVHRRWRTSDLRWKRRVFRSWRKKLGEYWTGRLLPGVETSFGGAQGKVKRDYEGFWGGIVPGEHLSTEGKLTACEWGRDGMLARGIGTKRVHLLLLERAFEALEPESVLEVGSGYGVNLFSLAGYFPATRFAGVELTRQGVRAAAGIARKPDLPEGIADFLRRPHADPGAHARIDFVQGSARSLPFPDASFDVVCTVLALEAMEEIRHQALRELARVARRHVVMIEPFLDLNETGVGRLYHASRQYFRGRIDELGRDGLEPQVVYSDFPHKIRLWPALVIARPLRP